MFSIRTLYSSNSAGTSFPVTSSRTCWERRQLPRNKLATSYEEVRYTPDHLDMSRWSESRQLPRNFLVTSWRLPRNICCGEVTGKMVPVGFELIGKLRLRKSSGTLITLWNFITRWNCAFFRTKFLYCVRPTCPSRFQHGNI